MIKPPDSRTLAVWFLTTIFSLGCTKPQIVPVECVNHPVEIFVDGRMREANPELLELSPDEPHVVFVRAPGFMPQRYVFETQLGADGKPRLTPENLCIELIPKGQGRELEVEIYETPSAPP